MVLPTDIDGGTQHAESSTDILAAIKLLHDDHLRLADIVESIGGRVNMLAGIQQVGEAAVDKNKPSGNSITLNDLASSLGEQKPDDSVSAFSMAETAQTTQTAQDVKESPALTLAPKRPTMTSRIILTTYPGQAGIDPVIMNWGHKDPSQRGPVVVSRAHGTLRRRNGL
jgi:hypothetical protein